VQPVLGADVQGGERELALRGAGGAVRLPVHEPGLELSVLFAGAVFSIAPGSHAARGGRRSDRQAGSARRRRSAEGDEPGWPVARRLQVSGGEMVPAPAGLLLPARSSAPSNGRSGSPSLRRTRTTAW